MWGHDWFGDARTVDVHIAQVRKKLGDAVTITTVRGVGYRLESGNARRLVSPPRRRLRTRLLVAMVGVAFGVLVVTALGAAGLARETSGDAAISDLRQQAPEVAGQLEGLGRAFRRAARLPDTATRRAALNRACRLVASTVKISGGSVVVADARAATSRKASAACSGARCADRAAAPRAPPRPADLATSTSPA